MSTAKARELAVLSVLNAHAAHGYQIAKAFETSALALLGLRRAAVYAVLDRFKARGWVYEQAEAGSAYPDRQVIHLTDAGRAALESQVGKLDGLATPMAVPLMAVMMCIDAGMLVPADVLRQMIAERQAQLRSWGQDHAATATDRLGQRLLGAELATLEELLRGA